MAGLGMEDFGEMRSEPSISKTAKLPGLLPIFEGMGVVLDEILIPPKMVRGTPCTVVGIELHPSEPPLAGRESIVSDGCVVLHYTPKCVYVRVAGSDAIHLPSNAKQLRQVS